MSNLGVMPADTLNRAAAAVNVLEWPPAYKADVLTVIAQALMEEREKAAMIADDIAANTLPAATEAHQIANDIGRDTARVIAATIRSGGE